MPNIIIDEPRTCAQVGGVVHGRGRPRAASAPRRSAVASHGWPPRIRHFRDPLLGSRLWKLDYVHGTGGGRLCGGRAASGSGAGAFGNVVEHAADASSRAV